ncbi:coenzyme F420-0:L-glutamate ligase [Candidatus Tisiphia endosymbiont of Melanophora roralis]|uniref:coenzyme F420-0:L-glutamate ligase n=1 Tax=Candidatus Tisiphia endosymbiont of Melanophora roralis TaxID=3066261 RepID=UPI00312C7056
MQIHAIKTHKIQYGESLQTILTQYIADLKEGDVVAITSKVISVLEVRFVKKGDIDKYTLILQEADQILETEENRYDIYLTLKNGLLIPSAGIDESNADGVYVLYPQDVQKTAYWIWQYLCSTHNICDLGIVITDSHTTIMRRGVTGIALGWCGFSPLYSYIGKHDIYNQSLNVTQINILDSLAGAAVFVMGEGNEQTPITIIKDAPRLTFLDRPPSEEEKLSIVISMEEDLYGPLLKSAKWVS